MLPYVQVLGWSAPTYPIFMILGFVLALGTILALIPAAQVNDEGGVRRAQAWDLYVVMVVSALLGGKIGHTLLEAPGHVGRDGQKINSVVELLSEDPLHWLWIHQPGYVWYGGMISCLLIAIAYFRKRPHLNAWLFSDLFSPAVMMGAWVGRLGCFFAGCCHGVPTEGPLGVQFPHLEGPVHPTQLYDAVSAALIGVVLIWRFPRRRFDGENIALLLMAYPVFRSATEAFRGDAERGFLGPLSTSQWLSIPLFLAGLIIYRRQRNLKSLSSGSPSRSGSSRSAEPTTGR